MAYPLGARDAPDAGREREATDRVRALLHAAATEASVAALASDPVLLAAFFQNVDLLYDAGSERADATSALVMGALALLEDQE